MSKYIKDNSLSIGYNPVNGQQFFDILKKYERYIHSYFFSLTETCNETLYSKLNIDMIDLLKSVDTYNFPANLLINSYMTKDFWKNSISDALDLVNLKGVTVLDGKTAKEVKKLYPDLEVHLSVRYFDGIIEIDPKDLLNLLINDKLIQYIDVINISGVRSYNDFKLIEKIHECGVKVKFIVNEACIINRDANYSKFPGCSNNRCNYKNPKDDCHRVVDENPWLHLARSDIYKEQLRFYDIDIIKISTRMHNNEYVDDVLSSWTSDEPTKYIGKSPSLVLDVSKHYNEYLEWCVDKTRYCSGRCFTCRLCEKHFENMTK